MRRKKLNFGDLFEVPKKCEILVYKNIGIISYSTKKVLRRKNG
jgi:hypothetical protein